MRVLMVTPQLPSPDSPGTLAPLVRQIESLRRIGADVSVLEVRGVKVLRYPMAVPTVWRMARDVDVVHAHYGFCGWLARSQWLRPVVVSFMGSDLLGHPGLDGQPVLVSRVEAALNLRFARMADAVIVKSPEMAAQLNDVPCTVLPNGVDTTSFTPMSLAEARARLGWSSDARHVLFAGCPDDIRKGYALAQATIEIAQARSSGPITLVVLWDVPATTVPLYMNASDAMLFTSLWEGSPNVVKEAMACDLPVVSVPVGDVDFLLGDVYGCAIGPRNADTLANLLLGVLARGERSEGRSGLMRKGLDQETVARRLLALYEQVQGSPVWVS